MADLSEGLVTSREAYVAALRAGVELAAQQGCRDMCWMDNDFSQWPLSDAEVLEALSRWALPHRRLHLLAAHYDHLRQRHPRFVQWRRHWDHVVTARQYEPDDLPAGGPQALMLAPGLFCFKLLDARTWRATCSFQTADQIAGREWFDAIEQRASEAFAASTLGL